jgi:alginate O-acetyltransferase complex protein AlgJ
MIAAASALRYELAGGSVEVVRVGREGWLFLGDELQLADEAAAWNRERIGKIADVKRALEARGVSLVVALVPDKARVYSRFVPASDVPPAHAARYGEALAALRSRGVNAIDLLAPLAAGAREGEVYYRTDTHWSQRGAKIAAEAIAGAVRSSGVTLEPAKFTNRVEAEVERPGDLIRLMGLEHAPKILRPAADRERPITTQAMDAGASLLGDFEIPATLIGTSYSLRANFHGFLQEALGARVLNAARDGSGLYQSANEYFSNEAFRASPPKVVIWEIPERVLSEKPASPEALPLGGTPSHPPA